MRKGFTLIELLVVIAIIAILAAILFPVFARAREKARQTSCLSNCKQMALAIMMYTDDHDEMLPGYVIWTPTEVDRPVAGTTGYYLFWMDVIYPYVKNKKVFICPSYDNPSAISPHVGYGWNIWIGYMLNHPTETGQLFNSLNLSMVVHPAELVVAGDAPGVAMWVDHWDLSDWEMYSARRHNNGDNFFFADGHAKWFPWKYHGKFKWRYYQ